MGISTGEIAAILVAGLIAFGLGPGRIKTFGHKITDFLGDFFKASQTVHQSGTRTRTRTNNKTRTNNNKKSR